MNGTRELLNFVYQNAQMGTATIHQLTGIVESPEFKKHLEEQLEGYRDMEREATELLEEQGGDEKGLTAFEKMKTYLMIEVQTLTDKSTAHIAEMMMVGSTMGVVNAIKNLRKYPEAEHRARALMERLQHFEERNMEQLKKFL